MTERTTVATDYSEAPYLAVCDHYYGRGFTVDEAKSNMKAQGGRLTSYFVYKLPEGATDAFVDDFGSIRWTWAENAPDQHAQGEIVAKRGLRK